MQLKSLAISQDDAWPNFMKDYGPKYLFKNMVVHSFLGLSSPFPVHVFEEVEKYEFNVCLEAHSFNKEWSSHQMS